jgi:hypothetical protein
MIDDPASAIEMEPLMQIPVVVETLGVNQFRAEAPAPFSVTAEAKTSAEAVQNLRARIEKEFANGKQIVALNLEVSGENPWIQFAGHLKDETFLSDFQEGLVEYRRQRDPDDA